MNRLTAHLALIAYLVGGWLLPATHQHGHDHAVQGSACCCIDDEVVLQESVTERHSHDGCCRGSENVAMLAASDHDLSLGHSSGDCQGLCALCCALNLTGQIADDSGLLSVLADADDEPLQFGLTCPLSPICGGLFSRGPPTV
jgi:hypothetical protein